jgi:hypothetical protein
VSKKIIVLAVVAIISASLIACTSKSSEDTKSNTNTVTEENYQKLEGEWANDVTMDELKSKYNSLLAKVEAKTKEYKLEYKKSEEVKEEKGETVNKNYIYLDQKNPEKNRLESLYFGLNIYGEDLNQGQITMKLSLNFDGEKALKDGEIKFQDTSIAAYSKLFTNEANRDFSDINDKILEVLKSDKAEGVIENSIDGLYEEFTVTKDYIVYKIETKKLDFVDKAN